MDYKKELESTFYNIRMKNTFYGSIIQSMNIYKSRSIQTAGVRFNPTNKLFEMIINDEFFQSLSVEEQCDIIHHEIKHITHGHLVKIQSDKIAKDKMQLMNIAGDMVINQELKYIPRDQVLFFGAETEDLAGKQIKFKTDNEYTLTFSNNGEADSIAFDDIMSGVDLAKAVKAKIEEKKIPNLDITITKNVLRLRLSGKNVNIHSNCQKIMDFTPVLIENYEGLEKKQSLDYYYLKLKERKDNNQCIKCGKPKEDGDQCCEGEMEIDHAWLDADEAEKLAALKKLLQRSLNKTSFGYTSEMDGIKELLKYIEGKEENLNYAALLLYNMRVSLPANKRVQTWTRKNRRFGYTAPGKKNGDFPKLSIFIDTSGSISIEEANTFLKIVDKFLEVGARKCTLNLFHTSVYNSFEYKKNTQLDSSIFQSGGTCLKGPLENVAKTQPDLSIFLTDGYYSDVNTESMVMGGNMPKTLFIISKEGNSQHPFSNRKWAKTVKIPS